MLLGAMMTSIGNQPTIYLVERDGIVVFLMPWGEEFGGKLVKMRCLWDFSWRFNTGIHLWINLYGDLYVDFRWRIGTVPPFHLWFVAIPRTKASQHAQWLYRNGWYQLSKLVVLFWGFATWMTSHWFKVKRYNQHSALLGYWGCNGGCNSK